MRLVNHKNPRLVAAMVMVAIVVSLGTAFLFHILAATQAVAIEAEAGNITVSATTGNDTNASGGKYVQFSGQSAVTPLPNPGAWTDVTSNLVGMSTDCGTVTSVYTVPGTNKVIAGLAKRGLWVSSNDGSSWTQMPGSTIFNHRPISIVFDPTNANIFWETGLYDPPGVNKTSDGGNTFQTLGDVEDLFSVTVDFSDPARQRILAGARRRPQMVWKTTDGGKTWTNIGLNLPGGTGITTHPIFINATTFLVNTDPSSDGIGGVWRTTNGGTSWQQVSSLPPRNAPLVTANGTIYWSSTDGLAKSTDSGLTWKKVGSGLLDNFPPIELPDGRIVSSNGSNLVVSADGGSTWKSFGAAIPPTPNGASGFTNISYSATTGAFYAAQFTCEAAPSPVRAGAVMRLH